MFFLAWRLPGAPLQDGLASRLDALLRGPKAQRTEIGDAVLVVWSPAGVRWREGGIAACAVSFAAAEAPSGHPVLSLTEEGVSVSAPPFPQYPAYYVRGPGDGFLLVSSRLEPLVRLFPEAPLSARRLACWIRWSSGVTDLDVGGTAYAPIRRIRGGEQLRACRRHGVVIQRELPSVAPRYRHGAPAQVAHELHAQLQGTVDRLVGGAKRVAVLVSGGLDSSGVLALAARSPASVQREVLAISAQFASPKDDRPYFRDLIRAVGTPTVVLSARDAGTWLPRSMCIDAQPLNSTGSLMLMLSRAALDSSAGVTLHGGGGDTVMGGPLPFAQLARRGRPLAALLGAWRMRLPWRMSPIGRIQSLVISPLLPRIFLRRRRRRALRASWLTPRSSSLLESCRRATEQPPNALPDTPDAWMRALVDDPEHADAADFGGQMLASTGNAPSMHSWTSISFVSCWS
jgi:hypothetical protein